MMLLVAKRSPVGKCSETLASFVLILMKLLSSMRMPRWIAPNVTAPAERVLAR